jgi:hypothetical protein
MTTDAAIFCPHRIDDWIESPDCWLCPGCRCAVCSRCTRLFTAFLPVEEFEDLWWEHSCDCRHTFSRHVLVPPRCWLRDHPAVEGDEKAVAAVVPAERTHAEPLDGRQAMMSLISSMERLNASTTPGQVQVSAENLHAVLDEAQKLTLYFHAIGDDHWHSKLRDIAGQLRVEVEKAVPAYINADLKYAAGIKKVLCDGIDLLDIPGGADTVSENLQTRLLVRGMTESAIRSRMSRDAEFRERVRPLFPAMAEAAAVKAETKRSWWQRLTGRG